VDNIRGENPVPIPGYWPKLSFPLPFPLCLGSRPYIVEVILYIYIYIYICIYIVKLKKTEEEYMCMIYRRSS
jgi:hypothetical protein